MITQNLISTFLQRKILKGSILISLIILPILILSIDLRKNSLRNVKSENRKREINALIDTCRQNSIKANLNGDHILEENLSFEIQTLLEERNSLKFIPLIPSDLSSHVFYGILITTFPLFLIFISIYKKQALFQFFKFFSGFLFFIMLILFFTNPEKKDFDEFIPSKSQLYGSYSSCEVKEIHTRRSKNYLFFSKFELSYKIGSIEQDYDENCDEQLKHKFYLGILNNFFIL